MHRKPHLCQTTSVHMHYHNNVVRFAMERMATRGLAARRSRRRLVCRCRQRSAGCRGCARMATWRRATSGDHVARRMFCVSYPCTFRLASVELMMMTMMMTLGGAVCPMRNKLITLARETSPLTIQPRLSLSINHSTSAPLFRIAPCPSASQGFVPLSCFSEAVTLRRRHCQRVGFGLALCGTRRCQAGSDVRLGASCSVLSAAVQCNEGVPTTAQRRLGTAAVSKTGRTSHPRQAGLGWQTPPRVSAALVHSPYGKPLHPSLSSRGRLLCFVFCPRRLATCQYNGRLVLSFTKACITDS